MPPFSVVAGSLYGYVAYALRDSDIRRARLFTAAAVLSMGIMPYTIGVMRKVNAILLRKAEEADRVEGQATEVAKADGEKTEDMMATWAMYNSGRVTLPILATVTAIVGFLGY